MMMVGVLLSSLLVMISAIAKAVADTIKHYPDTSIFRNSRFWIGEGKTIPFTKYKVDGWHIANSIMIVSFLGLIFVKEPIENLLILHISLGIFFILVFNLFYNKIFRIKGWKS